LCPFFLLIGVCREAATAVSIALNLPIVKQNATISKKYFYELLPSFDSKS